MKEERPTVFQEYLNNAVEYLTLKGYDREKIQDVVKSYIRKHCKSPQITHRCKNADGDMEVVKEELWKHINRHTTDVVTPSGSVYQPSYQGTAKTTEMIIDQMKERKEVKKKALDCRQKGLDEDYQRFNNIQTSIKINMNSLIGAKGSPYNLFYDLAGFNSVTSLARSLIAYAYTTAERNLTGNFGFFSEEDVINHIVVVSKHCPSAQDISDLVTKFDLKEPTPQELFKFFKKDLRNNFVFGDHQQVADMVNMLPKHLITYLFYYANIKHLIQLNPSMRIWVEDLLNIQPTKEGDPDSIPSKDGDLVILSMLFMYEELGSMSPYALAEKNKPLAAKFAGLCDVIASKLHDIQPLFDTFIHVEDCIPAIGKKKKMYRNSVIVSDTDSVIFTASSWEKWRKGNVDTIDAMTYRMTGLVVYWLTKSTENILKNFSEAHGAFTDAYNKRMKMKNEFLYPVMLVYDIKKTYAALTTVQEGKVFKSPEIDIKGANLRSSSICARTTEFIKKFIEDDILKKSVNDKLNPMELIKKVVDFERVIIKSVVDDHSYEFLQLKSINQENSYKDSNISAYRYYQAWMDIFADKYGEILLPTKVPLLPLVKLTNKYTTWLEEKHKKVSANLIAYMKKHDNKFVPSMPLNPDAPIIPKELIPLVDVRHVVYNNMKPVYLTLDQLGISVGYKKQKVLFSDVYPNI